MTQSFDLRLEGDSVQITGGELTLTFDTPNDGFSCALIVSQANNPKLYQQVSPYQGTPAEVYIEDELKLTGTLTLTERDKDNQGDIVNISGWSNTFKFWKSQLLPPYQYENVSMHSAAIIAGRQTATRIVHPVKFDTEKSTTKFPRITVVRGQSAAEFIAPLAAIRNHVISSTTEGDVILQQANIKQPPVGTIDESKTLIQTQFKGEWSLLSRPREIRVVNQTPGSQGHATATDPNINLPLRQVISAYNDLKGNLKSTADWALKTRIVQELTQEIPVIGWYAPNGELWNPDTLLTLVSETLWVPNGFTYFIRAVKFILDGTTKTAILSLIPKEIYTNEPVKEPWFQAAQANQYLQYQSTRGG